MRKFIWLIFCVALAGCSTSRSLPFREGLGVGLSPDTTALPTFPAEALYVLGAQWEADSLLQQEQSIADYMEQELIRLYPEKAYKGYIHKLCSAADRLLASSKQRPTLFAPQRQEITFTASPNRQSPTGVADLYLYLDSLSQSEELQLMDFTP